MQRFLERSKNKPPRDRERADAAYNAVSSKKVDGGKPQQTFDSDAGGLVERLAGEESLMRDDEHIWKGQQARQFLFHKRLAEKIFEEDVFPSL